MQNKILKRAVEAAKAAIPQAVKTSIWVVKITVIVSFAILLLKYINVLPWISEQLSPLFYHLGLPGEASLAFVSGYFTNVYTAIAVAVSLDLDARAMTLLGIMALCAHNMITETLVQKKTGTNAWLIVAIRTSSALIIPFVLNIILPGSIMSSVGEANVEQLQFLPMLKAWAISSGLLVLKMVAIIITLSIVQKLLNEFGVIAMLSRAMGPFMKIFGLSRSCSFLWIVANTLGLAYGAAIMIDEAGNGSVSKRDIDYLNAHISMSHSNLEDLFLVSSIGAVWYTVLISRWIFAIVAVWLMHLHFFVTEKNNS